MQKKLTLQIKSFGDKNKQHLISKLLNASLFVLVLSAFSWHCKKDDSTGGSTGICPKIVAVSPDSMGSFPINTSISVTFNEEIDPFTINANTFLVNRGVSPSPVAGIITYSNKVALFKPTDNLNPHDAYNITITTGIKDTAGNALPNNFKWTFSTSNLPVLASASKLAVLGGNSGITNQGLNTLIYNGGIATTTTSNNVTGFHDTIKGTIYNETILNVGRVAGNIDAGLPSPGSFGSFLTAAYALIDATNAYNTISPTVQTYGIDLPIIGEIGGITYTSGVYKALSNGISITNGDLTLDAKGDPNASWIFQTTFDLMIGNGIARNIILVNGALAKNVYWYVGGTATINQASGGAVNGIILAYNGINISSIANTQQSIINGRVLCINGAVNMFNTTINAQ